MALQNLSIPDTVLRIGTQLVTDPKIIAYCVDNFGKKPTVYAGDMTRKDIPDTTRAPYIVVTDFKKQEGQNIEFCQYTFTLWVGIATENTEYEKEGKEGEEDGAKMPANYRLCGGLMTLLEEVLNDPAKNERPCSKVNTDGPFPLEPRGFLWVGKMTVIKRIYQTLGTPLQEQL